MNLAQSTFSAASPLLRVIHLNHYTKRSRRMNVAQSTLSSASPQVRLIHLNQYTKRSRRMDLAQSTFSAASPLLRVIHLNQYTKSLADWIWRSLHFPQLAHFLEWFISISIPKVSQIGFGPNYTPTASPLLRVILLNHYTKKSRRMNMDKSTLSSASPLLRLIHLNQDTKRSRRMGMARSTLPQLAHFLEWFISISISKVS